MKYIVKRYKHTLATLGVLLVLSAIVFAALVPNVAIKKDIGSIAFETQKAAVIKEQQTSNNVVFSLMLDKVNNTGADAFVWINYGVDSPYFRDGIVDSIIVKQGSLTGLATIPYVAGPNSSLSLTFVSPTGLALAGQTSFTIETIPTVVNYKVEASTTSVQEGQKITYFLSSVDSTGNLAPFDLKNSTTVRMLLNSVDALYLDKKEINFTVLPGETTASVDLFVRSHIGEQWNGKMGRFLDITPNNVLYQLHGTLPRVVIKDNAKIAKATFKRVETAKTTTKPGKWTAFELAFESQIPDTVYANALTFERFTSANGITRGKIDVSANLGACTSFVEQQSQWINNGVMSIKFFSPIPSGLFFEKNIIDPEIKTTIEPYQLSVIQTQGIYEGETLFIGVKSDEKIDRYADANQTIKLIATGSLIPNLSQTYEIPMTNLSQGIATQINVPLAIGEQAYGKQTFEVQAQTGISALKETVIVKDSTNIAYINLEFLNSTGNASTDKRPAGRHVEIKGTVDSTLSTVLSNTTNGDVLLPIYSEFENKVDSEFVAIHPNDSSFIYNFAIPATRVGYTTFYIKKDAPDGIFGKESPKISLESYVDQTLIPVKLCVENNDQYNVTTELGKTITVIASLNQNATSEVKIPLVFEDRYFQTAVSTISIRAGNKTGNLMLNLIKDYSYDQDITTQIKVASSLDNQYSEPDTPVTVTIKGFKKLNINAISSKNEVELGESFKVRFESDPVTDYLEAFDGSTGSFEIATTIINIEAIGGAAQKSFNMIYDQASSTYKSDWSSAMTADELNDDHQPEQFVKFKYLKESNILNIGKEALVKILPSEPIDATLTVIIPDAVDSNYGTEGKTFTVEVCSTSVQIPIGNPAYITFSDTQYIEGLNTLDTQIYFGANNIAVGTFKYKTIPNYQGKREFTIRITPNMTFIFKGEPTIVGIIDDPRMNATIGTNLGINDVRMGTSDAYKVTFNQDVDTESLTLKLNSTGSKWYTDPFNSGSHTITLNKGESSSIIPVKFNKQPNPNEFIGQQVLTLDVDSSSAKTTGVTSTPWQVNLLPEKDIVADLKAEPTTIYDAGELKLTYTLPQVNKSGKPIVLKTIVPKEYFTNVQTGTVETIIEDGNTTGSTVMTVTDRLTNLALPSSFKVIPVASAVPGIINPASNELTIKTKQGNALLAFAKHSDRTFRGKVFNYVLKSSKVMAADAKFKITYDNSVWGGTGIEILTMRADSNMVTGQFIAKQPAAEGTYLTISPDSVIEPFALGENSKLEVIVLDDVPKFEWISGAKVATINEGKSTTLTIRYVGGGESLVATSNIEVPLVLSGNTPPSLYTIGSKFILPKGSKINQQITVDIKTNSNTAIDPDYTLNIGLFKDVKKYYISDIDLEPYVLTIKDTSPPSSFTQDVGFTNISKVEIPSSIRVLKQIAIDDQNATVDISVSGKSIVPNVDIILYDELGNPLPFENKRFKLKDKKKLQVEFKTHSQKTFTERDITLTLTNAIASNGTRLNLDKHMKKAIISYLNISPNAVNDFKEIAFEDIQVNSFYKINPLANDTPSQYTEGGVLNAMMINGVRKLNSTDTFQSDVVYEINQNKVRFYVSEESKNITVDLTEYKQWNSSHASFSIEYEVLQANGGRANATIEFIIGKPTTRGDVLTVKADAIIEATGQGTGFTAVPKMHGVYYDQIKDPDFKKPKKMSLKSLTKIPRGQAVQEINLSMGQPNLMYNKKNLSTHYKQGKYLKEFIDEKDNQLNRLGVTINSKQKINGVSKEISFSAVVVVPPSVDTQAVIPYFDDTDSTPSYILDKKGMIGYKIKGNFFGNKPKAYLQYSTTSLTGVTKIKNIKLSILTKYTNRANQKITFPKANGVVEETYIWVKMPKAMPKGANERIDLYIDSGTAFGVYQNFPLKEILTISPMQSQKQPLPQ